MPARDCSEVFLDLQVFQLLLVPEKDALRFPRILLLVFEFPPPIDIGVMNPDLRAHLVQTPDKDLRAAVAGIPHILPVRCAEDEDFGRGDRHVHVPQGVADKLRCMERTGVIDVDGRRRHFEDVVLEPEDVLVSPYAEAAVFGQAVAADARPGKDYVAVSGPHLDRFDHLDDVHAVCLRKKAPLVKEGQDRGPVAVFNDLRGFRLYRSVEHRERELVRVEDFVEELHHPRLRLIVDAAADPPEVAYGGDVVLSGHHPFIAVRKQRVRGDAAAPEHLADGRQRHLLRRAGRTVVSMRMSAWGITCRPMISKDSSSGVISTSP